MENTHRYIARFIAEAETPLFVGSGQSSLLKDALVAKDANGFPLIPGTSLAGVLRHAVLNDEDPERWLSVFGDQDPDAPSSRIKFSSAYMMLNENICSEGILHEGSIDENILLRFTNLPARQHVRLSHKGTAEDRGLFDNEIVYKGVRFIFELELRGNSDDAELWRTLLDRVKDPMFRIGAGTRKGYGKLKVLKCFSKSFDLSSENDFYEYLAFDHSLNAKLDWESLEPTGLLNEKFIRYDLELSPEDFFVFSAGHGDDDADNKPLMEEIVCYNENGIQFMPDHTVIPGTSVKGAIAHRTAFHYNRFNGSYSDRMNPDELEDNTGTSNAAVYHLFGDAAGSVKHDAPKAGNVYLNDLFFTPQQTDNSKILNHVAVDRFTGGALHGALFSEKVSRLNQDTLQFSVFVKKEQYPPFVTEALEESLKDICKGLLPLGGMTTKGNGMFTGKLFRDEQIIFDYASK